METQFAFDPDKKAAQKQPGQTSEELRERADKERAERDVIFGEARKAMVAMDDELVPLRKKLAEVDIKIKEEEGRRKKAVALMYKIDGRSVEEVLRDSLAAEEESGSIPDRPGQDKIREIDGALQALMDERKNLSVDMLTVIDRYIKDSVLERERAIQEGALPDDLRVRTLDESLKRMRGLLNYGDDRDEREPAVRDSAVRRHPAGGDQNGGAGEEASGGEKTKQEEYRKGKLDETFRDIRNRFGEKENSGEFDASRGACEPFGFYAGEHVSTPTGPMKVVGVKFGNLWFLDVASDGIHENLPFSWGLKTKKEFESKGFYKL
jgi:hypothetical protein